MNILKKFSLFLATAVICSEVWLPKAIAQKKPSKPVPPASSDCYIKTSDGRTVSLGGICGDGTGVRSNRGVYQARIKRRQYGIPVIDVLFTSKTTKAKFEMMVDTGASSTAVTTQMAQALGIVVVSKSVFSTASDNRVEVPLGYIRSIEVNGAIAEDILVGIIPSLDIGLLGHDFFGNFDITVKRDIVEFRVSGK